MTEVQDAGKRRSHGRIGTVIKDKWRVDARIGSGGMATVYAATHRNGNRVAIKMLHSEMSHDQTLRTRFLREGYVANQVSHPGAVRVLDDDVAEDGSVFLVMELLEGESLEARRMRLGGRLPVEEVFTVGAQLLDLLSAAHAKGIIHRDIKPENIFVTQEGQIKVLDFGIARMRDQSNPDRTSSGLMLGTPDFMSPEQAGGVDVDARSDLWATGATLFTLLSGEFVHSAPTLRDHLVAVATTPARSLARAMTGAPRQVVTVIDRALALEKESRFQDALSMKDAWLWAYRAVSAGDDGESVTMMAAPPPSSGSPSTVSPRSLDEAISSGEKTLLSPPSRPEIDSTAMLMPESPSPLNVTNPMVPPYSNSVVSSEVPSTSPMGPPTTRIEVPAWRGVANKTTPLLQPVVAPPPVHQGQAVSPPFQQEGSGRVPVAQQASTSSPGSHPHSVTTGPALRMKLQAPPEPGPNPRLVAAIVIGVVVIVAMIGAFALAGGFGTQGVPLHRTAPTATAPNAPTARPTDPGPK